MAYLRSIVSECDRPGCTARATEELLNNRNASVGRYCGRHAKVMLREFEAMMERWRDERAEDKA